MADLTIVIPTFEGSALPRAMKSVAAQSIFTDLIVMVDDFEIGAGPTRNRAVQLVQTEWVGFLDDDDRLDRHYHKWLILESPEYDVVIFQMQIGGGIIIPGHMDVNRLVYKWVGISFAMKTEWARRYPFKNMIGEDYDLLMRLKLAGARIKISDRVAYYVRGN